MTHIRINLHSSIIQASYGGWVSEVPVNKELLTGTVPVNNKLLTGTVPVNKELLTGTVPVNNLILNKI